MTIYDDEIDLRPYINALIENWVMIILLAVVFAALTLGITVLNARSYEATAALLIPHSQLQLSLAEQFPTVAENVDTRSRMDAYLTIAKSDAIAQQVYRNLDESITQEFYMHEFDNMISISNQGDAILITATAPSSQMATEIANEWAYQTVQTVNLAYSGERPLEEIQIQIEAAGATYQKVQADLETFIRTNPLAELQAALNLAEKTLNSPTNNLDWQISHRYHRQQQLTQISDQANILKSQLENGNISEVGNIGDALAVMSARTNSFPTNETSSFDLQITDTTALLDTSPNYVQDINTIIELADEENQQITLELESLIADSLSETDVIYTPITSKIQILKAQLENLTARERELTSERDLAWENYQALLQKETEIKTTSQTNPVVTFASPAVPPTQPIDRQLLMKTVIAGVIGGLIGVIWVIVRLWWQSNQLIDSAEAGSPEN